MAQVEEAPYSQVLLLDVVGVGVAFVGVGVGVGVGVEVGVEVGVVVFDELVPFDELVAPEVAIITKRAVRSVAWEAFILARINAAIS